MAEKAGVSGRPGDVVCALYRQSGPEGFNLLKGDFVIVHWRGEAQELTLVRDKFGIYNIYYVQVDSGTLVFSTSLKQLANTGLVNKEIDLNSLYQFFSLGVILPPRTVYQRVHSVEPGQYVRCRDGKLEKHSYTDIELPREKTADREYLVKTCLQLLTGAVGRACEDATCIGVYLSGGIDSAVVLSLAKQEAQGKQVLAFTMGPWGESSSELNYARLSAEFSGVEQVEWHAGAKDLNHLPYMVSLLEQPNFDTAALSYYLLAKEAKKYGVTTMLAGQNADTIMGAMPYVKYIYWSQRWQRYVPRVFSSALNQFVPLLPKGHLRNRLSFLLTPRTYVEKLLYFKTGAFYDYKDALFPFLDRIEESGVFGPLYDSTVTLAEKDVVDRVIYLDEKFTEQPRCVEVMQKCTPEMAARLPFFDQDVVDFALRMPDKIRSEENWDKMVLRDAARHLVHPEIYRRYKKSLVFPTHVWFGEQLYDRVLRYLATANYLREFIDIDKLGEILRRRMFSYGDIIYQVLVLAIWYRLNITINFKVTPDTSLEDVLDFDLIGSERE